MKDTLLNHPVHPIIDRFNSALAFIQASQGHSFMSLLMCVQLSMDSRSLRRKIKATTLPTRIENTQQYVFIMQLIDALEENQAAFNKLTSKNQLYGFLQRALLALKQDTDALLAQAYDLIKPFDSTPKTNYFFEVQDQREVWKRRNKNYTYLNLQPDRPEMEGLKQALATLED